VRSIAEGLPEEWQQHWAGTHFFNPPRYLKLVEIIPGPVTRPEVIETLTEFCDHKLGKGVVVAKDTPNFIANRIGTYSMLNAVRLMDELGMTFEEVDACTGPALGWPKSATFRTADIVGIDVLLHVVRNIYENIPGDESREFYRVPPLIEELARRGWLGDKTGRGFYQRVKKGGGESEILTLDPAKMDYRPQQKARFASIEAGKAIEDTRERLRMLVGPIVAGKEADKAQKFIWGVISEMCLYAARRAPEISDSIVDVDRAMRWGFGWNSAHSRPGTRSARNPWPSSSKMRANRCRRWSRSFSHQEKNRSISPHRARLLTSTLRAKPTSPCRSPKESLS